MTADVGREIRHERHMTDAEALMWAAERDPWMSSGMGSVMVLDTAPDFERFTATMLEASRTMLRLRERVAPGLGLAPPRWVIDDEFDIAEHVRVARLPAPGGMRELLDLASTVFNDPFDPHRPLWQFVAVEGSGSRRKDAVPGAIIMKLHHTVSDGIGAIRLAEMYLDLERDPPPRPTSPPIDPADGHQRTLDVVVGDVAHVARRPLSAARSAAAEVAMWGADPGRVRSVISKAGSLVRAAASQVGATASPAATGSPIWRHRSRHRQLHVVDLELEPIRAAARALDLSVNDVFVAGSVLAAARLHEAAGEDVTTFNVSFIVSTRADDAAGGNSFAPLPFEAPADITEPAECARRVAEAMAATRSAAGVGTAAAMEMVSGLAVLLPPSLLSRAARARAARLDWATSNLRGVPIPIYVAGGEVTHMYPVGPLAGTAFNLTALSYNGGFHLGLNVDPKAVEDPTELVRHLEAAFRDLLMAPEGPAAK